MERSGLGAVIKDLALSLAGRSIGGPAKVAVLASSLFGTISGSAAANVVSTGVFTIPLMKSIGYSGEFAGAVEAVASTGGQLMPPIMGAAAFIMADILGALYECGEGSHNTCFLVLLRYIYPDTPSCEEIGS